jgi:hypothetical protein
MTRLQKLTYAALVVNAVLLAVNLLGLARSCRSGPDPAYWVSRAEYDQTVADMEDGLKHVFEIVAARDATIKLQDEFVALGQRKIMEQQVTIDAGRRREAAQTAELRGLRTAEVEELMERYPALKAYDLAKDALLDTKDELIFTLTMQGREKDGVIEAQAVEIVQLKYNYNDMKKAWESEHKTRLAGDALRLDLERQYKAAGTWKWIAIITNAAWGAAAIL